MLGRLRFLPRIQRWRRRFKRLLTELNRFGKKHRNAAWVTGIILLILIIRKLSRAPGGEVVHLHNITTPQWNLLVNEPQCRIVSGEANVTDSSVGIQCAFGSCSAYTKLLELNDNISMIELTPSSRACTETTCCAAAYSMPRRTNYDEIRYPPSRCYPLKHNQKVYPTVYTEVLETTCDDLCDNRRVTNYHPLFALTPKVKQKMRNWHNYQEAAKKAIRVVLLVIDNVSAEAAPHFLPRTFAGMKSFYRMKGFSMVEPLSSGNLIAALTGLNVSTLVTKCSVKSMGAFDGCPFIWKQFRSLDYVTAFVDEMRLRSGDAFPSFPPSDVDFIAQPTDYYIPPSFIKEKMKPFQMDSGLYNAFASTSPQDFILEYGRAFVKKFKKLPFLVVLRIAPSWGTLENLDLKLNSFLRAMRNSENILTFLYSHLDAKHVHIQRPFLYLSLPGSLEGHSVELEANSGRFTTVFDVYETLRGIVKGTCSVMGILDEDCPAHLGSQPGNGGAVLLDQISPHRTCAITQVPAEICPCNVG